MWAAKVRGCVCDMRYVICGVCVVRMVYALLFALHGSLAVAFHLGTRELTSIGPSRVSGDCACLVWTCISTSPSV